MRAGEWRSSVFAPLFIGDLHISVLCRAELGFKGVLAWADKGFSQIFALPAGTFAFAASLRKNPCVSLYSTYTAVLRLSRALQQCALLVPFCSA